MNIKKKALEALVKKLQIQIDSPKFKKLFGDEDDLTDDDVKEMDNYINSLFSNAKNATKNELDAAYKKTIKEILSKIGINDYSENDLEKLVSTTIPEYINAIRSAELTDEAIAKHPKVQEHTNNIVKAEKKALEDKIKEMNDRIAKYERLEQRGKIKPYVKKKLDELKALYTEEMLELVLDKHPEYSYDESNGKLMVYKEGKLVKDEMETPVDGWAFIEKSFGGIFPKQEDKRDPPPSGADVQHPKNVDKEALAKEYPTASPERKHAIQEIYSQL